MENQIEKINPIEYGLQESEVAVIEQAFMPKIAERDGYAVVYEQLITKELTKELCSEARELRLKLVKTRTGIADIHKSQKAYFLAAGKFVDAWKNKETNPIEQMEENLKSIETHYERIEAERIQKLEAERKEQVLKFTEFPAANLALMTDDVFNAYLKGVELAHNARIEEEKRIEAERIENLRLDKQASERRIESARFADFLPENIDYRNISQEDYDTMLCRANEDKKKHEAEQEKVRIENERLKAEAEAKEKALEAERKKQAQILADQQAKAEAERKAIEEKARKEREENDRKLKSEQEAAKIAADAAAKEQARLEYEIKQKEAAEEKVRKEAELKAIAEQKAKQAAAAAPDKEKIIAAIKATKMEVILCKSDQMQAVANVIMNKFEAWQKWAIDQTNNI